VLSSRTLFERLQKPASPDSHSTQQDLDDLRQSILRNLEQILNSREGMSSACPAYGIPDLTQIVHGIPLRAREVEVSLERCIQQYEPRLRDVRVEHIVETGAPMTASFRISARLKEGKDRAQMWFETVVVSSGRVRLT
jgi:type VI secretion system protein